MGIGDRHQKKDIEAALRRAEACGLKVTHDKSRHTWGYVICCPCSDKFTVHCTPQSAGNEAKKINGFINKHRGCA
ncbi:MULTISPECIES: hypothetical protein [Streptomyces]|uniref:Uncharacterized protein n=2 Tax=Streptomyces TaxID=1883 RepID=A0A646KQV4_STRJU|nr:MULTISPECIES: hypothetical protein [Streptomyces]MQS39087.1 hypothetical protein [Streptomyces katsurahamanus]MQT03396.1 hypothetical protein [Streptomyces jumonjinensis]